MRVFRVSGSRGVWAMMVEAFGRAKPADFPPLNRLPSGALPCCIGRTPTHEPHHLQDPLCGPPPLPDSRDAGRKPARCLHRPGGHRYGQQARQRDLRPGGKDLHGRGQRREHVVLVEDAMHFVWKKVAGDGAIAAQISWVGTSAQNHRKACLVIRQDLTPGSIYADVAQHGDGLTSLQFRTEAGGVTKGDPEHDRLPVEGAPGQDRRHLLPCRSLPRATTLHPSGASVKMTFTSPFYIGLAVSAHDNTAFETAVFSKVEVAKTSSRPAQSASWAQGHHAPPRGPARHR